MPRSRKKPSSDSDTSTKKRGLDIDASQECSISGAIQLSKSAGTSDGDRFPTLGSGSKRVGRPPESVPHDKAESLMRWLADGKPLREWCRQDGNPEWRTVYHWMDKDPMFVARIARAREDGYDVIADECQRLADLEPMDQVQVQWRRLQIETRLKLLAKWNPKKYGDRAQLDHGGGIVLNVVTNVPRD
jgi:hypothetical protein